MVRTRSMSAAAESVRKPENKTQESENLKKPQKKPENKPKNAKASSKEPTKKQQGRTNKPGQRSQSAQRQSSPVPDTKSRQRRSRSEVKKVPAAEAPKRTRRPSQARSSAVKDLDTFMLESSDLRPNMVTTRSMSAAAKSAREAKPEPKGRANENAHASKPRSTKEKSQEPVKKASQATEKKTAQKRRNSKRMPTPDAHEKHPRERRSRSEVKKAPAEKAPKRTRRSEAKEVPAEEAPKRTRRSEAKEVPAEKAPKRTRRSEAKEVPAEEAPKRTRRPSQARSNAGKDLDTFILESPNLRPNMVTTRSMSAAAKIVKQAKPEPKGRANQNTHLSKPRSTKEKSQEPAEKTSQAKQKKTAQKRRNSKRMPTPETDETKPLEQRGRSEVKNLLAESPLKWSRQLSQSNEPQRKTWRSRSAASAAQDTSPEIPRSLHPRSTSQPAPKTSAEAKGIITRVTGEDMRIVRQELAAAQKIALASPAQLGIQDNPLQSQAYTAYISSEQQSRQLYEIVQRARANNAIGRVVKSLEKIRARGGTTSWQEFLALHEKK